jgi:hypothetical protein
MSAASTSEGNESVEKILLTNENDVFGGHLILPRPEIVDRGVFCIVINLIIILYFRNLMDNF